MSRDARYPIGRFEPPAKYTAAERAQRIAVLAALPDEVRALVARLQPADLERRYRPGGWTVRQVTHHLADSHLNAYLRTKSILTLPTPTIMGYDQAVWAELPDVAAPVEASLLMLDGLHRRWVVLLRATPGEQFQRQMNHSEHGMMTLDHLLAMYAWHCYHHASHIRSALKPKA
ncbi:MAG: YfiT family bacillithiol transferase [Terriglobales bacterium]